MVNNGFRVLLVYLERVLTLFYGPANGLACSVTRVNGRGNPFTGEVE